MIAGSSGNTRSHGNDGPQGRDGKCFYDFEARGTFHIRQVLPEFHSQLSIEMLFSKQIIIPTLILFSGRAPEVLMEIQVPRGLQGRL